MQSLKCGIFFRPGEILEKAEDYGHHPAAPSIFWAMDPSTGLAKVLQTPLMYLHHPELGSSLEILACLVCKNSHK